MTGIDLSLISPAAHPQEIQKLVRRFEERGSKRRVNLIYQKWDTAWANMLRFGIYGQAPAVSEIGSTWVPDLVGMNALYPLPDAMVGSLGSAEDYAPHMWDSCRLHGSPQLWAAPWISGTRVIFYRRDLLEKAGVKADEAFATPAAMLQTMEALKAAGIPHPWTTSTTPSLNTLHLICSWIWAASGDILSADGRHLLFASEAVLRNITDFFALSRYLGPDSQNLDYEPAIHRFWEGDAAVTMDGSWIYHERRHSAKSVVENVGLALPPGPAFMGGSNLAIWAENPDKAAAQELLSFLLEPDSVLTISNLTGLLPVRNKTRQSPEFTSRPFAGIIDQAVLTGRSLSNFNYSAMVEDKLRHAFGLIWKDIFEKPEIDLHELVTTTLVPLKRRLEIIIQDRNI